MNGFDSIFDFPYLRNRWLVAISKPNDFTDPEIQGSSIGRCVRVEAEDEEAAKATAMTLWPGWSVDSIRNEEESARRRMAENIAMIFRDQ